MQSLAAIGEVELDVVARSAAMGDLVGGNVFNPACVDDLDLLRLLFLPGLCLVQRGLELPCATRQRNPQLLFASKHCGLLCK